MNGPFDALIADAMRETAVRDEERITRVLGMEFRQTVHVSVRRPRWMPDPVYRWLMQTIVIEEGPLR